MAWYMCGASSLLALAFLVMWLHERRESREWQVVCNCLGNEYDRLKLECRSSKPGNPIDQVTRWIN